MTREVFEQTGGFDEGLLSRGGVDNELCLRLWLLGYELHIIPYVEVQHLFRHEAPFRVSWTSVLHNRLRLAFVHFNRKRIRRVIEALQDHEGFASAISSVIETDICTRRTQLKALRVRSDDWYFDTFDLCW